MNQKSKSIIAAILYLAEKQQLKMDEIKLLLKEVAE